MSFEFETLFSSPSPWATGMNSRLRQTHGSLFHGRSHKETIELTLTAPQTTVMYMQCKHEMVNWSKWFRENPQTSHQINCCKHECTTATKKTCKSPFTWMKITPNRNSQVSSFRFHKTNCFTFHVYKTNKTLYNFSKTHANFSVHKLSSLFPVSHRLKPSYPI